MRLTKKQNNKLYPYIYSDIDDVFEGTPITKLGQYEDIEEELGIELLTLFKALKQQTVWTKYEDEIDLCDTCEYILLDDFIYFYWNSGKHLVFELKDYGKT